MRAFAFFILINLVLISCTTDTTSEWGGILAEGEAERIEQEKRNNDSFNPNDLSGCWKFATIFPRGDVIDSNYVFTKVNKNHYNIVDEDGATSELKISGGIYQIIDNSKTRKVETHFSQPPYQIEIIPTDSAVDFELPQSYGYQWHAKTCR